MHSNVNKAVWIIAAISLLLGLSIGQLHQQHQRIKNLEGKAFSNGFIYIGTPDGLIRSEHSKCRTRRLPPFESARQMEEMRARLDMERARLERERVKLHRELDRFIRMEKERIHPGQIRQEHVILKEEL